MIFREQFSCLFFLKFGLIQQNSSYYLQQATKAMQQQDLTVQLQANTTDRSNTAQQNDDQLKQIRAKLGATLCCFAVIVGVINLSFIIPSLVYAYQDTLCVLAPVEGFSFNLSVWLQVDAFMRIGIVALLMLMAITSCISAQAGIKCSLCMICIMILYSIFSMAWLIIGSVMFWGRLNPTGICVGPVQAYMYALLIISYVFTCCNCWFNLNRGKSQRQSV